MIKTREKNSHKLLKKAYNIYRSITQTAIDGFWIVDIKGHFLDVNDKYCKLTGYGRDEFLKMKLWEIEAIETPAQARKHIKKIIEAGEDRFLTRHRCKDSSIVDVEVTANYIADMGGLIFVFLRDISHRREITQAQIKKQSEFRKNIQEQMIESYSYLGTINRKISLLLELSKYKKTKEDKQKIIDHVLTLAVQFSKALTGFLYSSKGGGNFSLLSSSGVGKNKIQTIERVSTKSVGLLRHLIKEKVRVAGDIKKYKAELLRFDNKLDFFISLPLSSSNKLEGFIFLGFENNKAVSKADEEFLDILAIHASAALNKAGVFRKAKKLKVRV